MKTREIVISKYKEDISWSKDLNDILIYNKNDKDYNKGYIDLPNIGREGHTFLYHIIKNYDNLKDITIFLQGNPFDHCPDVITRINSHKEGFQVLSNKFLSCTLIGNKHYIENQYSYRHIDNIKFIRKIYKKITQRNDYKINLLFGWGAQSIVPKNRILSHSKFFYQELLEHLQNSKNPIDPKEGYALETLWFLIFNKNIFMPNRYIKY